MNTYENLKQVIISRKKSKEEITEMMDVFLMNNRISSDQYNELSKLSAMLSK